MPSLNLFPDNSKKSKLEIVKLPTTVKELTKEHMAFNKLTKRINNLQKKIESETQKMDSINALYHNEVFVRVQELGHHKIKLSHLLHEKRQRIKLSKAQNEKLDSVILALLDDAFTVIEADEAAKMVYDTYSDTDFDDEAQEDEEMLKSTFTQMFQKEFGMKLDPSLLDGPPDFTKIEEYLKQQIAEKEAHQKQRKKTKKQMEKEALDLQKEELKKKSLRSIYLSLAKLLHPDTEPDENLRLEKEEIMKKVTAAYDKRDMMELLKIEMQWVNTHQQNLDNTNANTIAIYVQLLKDQVQQLEYELNMVYHNPRYASIAEYKYDSESMAKSHLMQVAGNYSSTNRHIADQIQAIEQSDLPILPIKKCIEFYYEADDDSFSQQMW